MFGLFKKDKEISNLKKIIKSKDETIISFSQELTDCYSNITNLHTVIGDLLDEIKPIPKIYSKSGRVIYKTFGTF